MATESPFPTINVIPAKYRWTPEAAQKAATKGVFVRVGGTQVTPRYLSGAKRSWKSADPEENRTIFNLTYRITGTPESIRAALGYAGYTPEQIEAAIADSITSENWETDRYQDVVNEITASNEIKEKKPQAEGYELDQILWFAGNLKNAVVANKGGSEQKGQLTTARGTGNVESMADKIAKLKEGNTLDVSGMDYATGKGVRSIPAPKTDKAGKFGTLALPFISNNIDNYIRAIELAYGPEGLTRYADEIEVVRRALQATPTNVGGKRGQQQPQVIKAPSPAVVPGANLAPVPNFQRTAASPVAGVRTAGGNAFPTLPRANNQK